MKHHLSLLTLALVCTFTGCSKTGGTPQFSLPESQTPDSVVIERLDLEIADFPQLSADRQKAFLQGDSKDVLWGFARFIGDTAAVSGDLVAEWAKRPFMTFFLPEIRQSYPDLKAEQAAIGRIAATFRQNDLNMPVDRFVATSWGNQDRAIVIMDTIRTAFIALNHYLGPHSRAYQGWPEYRRVVKMRAMIPLDLSQALVATAYPFKTDGDATVLSRLIYEGALLTARQAMNPMATQAQLFGYTDSVYSQVVQNEPFVWKQLVKNRDGGSMLYSTDAETMSNLFDFIPVSSQISPDAPGRAARFVGYRIVQDYLRRNPDTTLKQLLSPEFYSDGKRILQASGYNPSKK